jgi:alkylglycerol monooxygenase
VETNYIALSVPVFFILIMIEILIARRQQKSYYRFNDAITDVSCGISQQAIGALIKGVLFAGYFFIYQNYIPWKFSVTSSAAWLIAFIGVDLAYYWWHRLSHEVNFLWAIHVVHHQSEDYNLAVALRQAWFSVVSSWPFYLPIVLLGVSPVVLLTMEAISTLYQFWIHTRTIGKLGFLEKIINTPSLHRVHHGRNYEYLDKNYAAILVIWDQIFGTYKEEGDEPLYGTVKPYTSWNPVWANFYYWVELWRWARKAPHFIDKFKIWIKFPGWLPRDVEYIPSDSALSDKPIRYDTQIPMGLNLYIAVNFLIVSSVIFSVLMNWFGSGLLKVIVVAAIIVTVAAWGGLFEKKSWAFFYELARLAVLAAISISYAISDQSWLPLMAVTMLALAGQAYWLLRYRKLFFAPAGAVVTA